MEKENEQFNSQSSEKVEEKIENNQSNDQINQIDQAITDEPVSEVEADAASSGAQKEEEPAKPVEMVEIPKTRLEELETAEAVALEEVKRERASAINYRKRLEKQRDEFAEYASARVLTKVLEANDDLARILENGEEAIPKEHLEGIKLLKQRLKGIFDAEGVTILRITEGKTLYNPKYHEAILTQPNEDVPDKTIVTEVSSGFVKGDRVLRVAKVIIVKHPVKKIEEAVDKATSDNAETESANGVTSNGESSGPTNGNESTINNNSQNKGE